MKNLPASKVCLLKAILSICFISGQVGAFQTSLLSSIHLQVPSSLQSSSNSNSKLMTSTTLSNLSRRDLSAKQTTIGTLYNTRQSDEQVARLQHQQARLQQQVAAASQPATAPVCQVFGGESVAIVEIEESRSNDMSQSTNPIELPISGSADDEIELKIESETQKYFKIQGKQLRLIKPLDRDAVLKDNSTTQQILSPQISSIYLQISCADKRQQQQQDIYQLDRATTRPGATEAASTRKNVIIPVLVKVLDLNDNAPKFSSPIYTVQVDELTAVNSILIDDIQAIDVDSANNGLIEYSLFSANGNAIGRRDQQQQQQPQRLVQRVAQDKQQTTQRPIQIMTTDPSVSSKLDIFTTVASLSSSSRQQDSRAEPESSLNAADSSKVTLAATQPVASSSNKNPTIDLNNEPILNGPIEDGSEEEESDEALLASMNSTDTEMEGDSDLSAMSIGLDRASRASGQRRRKKRSQTTIGRQSAFARRTLSNGLAATTANNRNLWTNLMAGGELVEMSTVNPGGIDSVNEAQYASTADNSATADDGALFALDFAPNTNRPIIRLKGELDYETKRVHYLTIVATDRAQNKKDRLSSKASIVIRVLDGDDQGPAFVLEQSGCATGALPQTTTVSPFVGVAAGSSSGANWASRFTLRGERRRRRGAMDISDDDPATATATSASTTTNKEIPNESPSGRPLPKGFKITEENFDYSDATRTSNSDDMTVMIPAAKSATPDRTQMSFSEAGSPNSTSASRSRRIVAAAKSEEKLPDVTPIVVNRQFDYGCLSNSPMSHSGGQAEYFSTIMSGDSDYVLRITPQTIKARDRDELNAPIKYSFVNGTPDSFGSYFQINPLDASVKQVAPVDRNRITRFVVWVRAQEQTPKRLSSLAKLTIDVVPTDKNPPVLMPNSYSGYVEENSPVGTQVMISSSTNRSSPMRINVIDVDQQHDSFRSKGSYEFDTTSDAFKVNRDGFVYVNRAQLDRDPPSQAVHIFQVTTRQSSLASSKSISSPISINVTLLDLNDNPPSIANSSLVPLQIKADGKLARQLTTIKCVDLDEPANSRVRYSIYHVSNNGRDRFRIHPDTGELEALGKFNSGDQYSLTIQVTDELGRSSQGILELSVVPGPNTGSPKFVFSQDETQLRSSSVAAAAAAATDSDRSASSPGYHVDINEGMAINSPVLQVRAIDSENDPITYNIIDGNINGDFYINTKTGVIYVANRLDREEVSGYKLLVQARDSGGLATNRPVTVTILDNNDENPIFQKRQYQFQVPEGSSSVGKVIGHVQALDGDAGQNGLVSYFDSSLAQQMNGPDGRALFAVDERTGDIRLIEALDYESAKSHTLLVTARDNGENPRSTTTSILIRVLDIQDEEPYFERNYIEVRVLENLANHSLAQLQAIDPDSVAQLVYELKYGDSSLFSVDPQTGLLTTLRALDYEQSANHTVIIGASGGRLSEDQLKFATSQEYLLRQPQQHERSAICRVDILVGDVNDVAPQFSSQPMPVRVQDTAQLGSMITRLIAEDHDGSEPNNQVRYELVAGADCAQLFMIDPTTGVLSVRSDLKRSSHSECNLMVKATDLGQQQHPLSSSVSVTIYIDHVAEISPTSQLTFADSSFTVEMDENPPPNSLVKVLTVINKPKPMLANYPISCEIVSGNEGAKFYVTQNEHCDCELRIRKSSASPAVPISTLDYELKQKYSLTIRLNTVGAAGHTGGSASGSSNLAHVNVNVLDRNDNKPVFNQPTRYSRLTQNRFLAAIAVDAPSESSLIQLRAQDLDSPHSNGLVSYELLNEGELGGRFRIDPTDGVVRTSRSLEDLPASLFPLHLRILARDNPDHAADYLSSTCEVLVNLIEDRHRLILVLRDSMSGRVLEQREELLAVLQERSGLIAGFERAESLKVQRNGTIESDVTGTDFWFYLIEPGTFRLVPSDDSRIKSKLLDGRAQSSLRDVVGETLGLQDASIRLPYSIVTGDPTLLGRTFSSHSSRSHLQSSVSSFASSLITVAMIIAILSAIVIVYQCGSRSSRRRRRRHDAAPGFPTKGGQLVPPLPGQYFHSYANQQQPGDYSTFNFPKIGPNAFLAAGQDNLAFSASAFSTLPSSGCTIAGVKDSSTRQQQQQSTRDPYQTELDRQAAMLGKEYETQMLKMSVLFDDTQSFDERTMADNLRLSRNPAHS